MPNSKRILLVEDDQAISQVLKIKLDSEGYQTTLAEDGSKALELLSSNEYDLMLLDLIMPDKNGFEVLEYLKENNINLKVIVITNLSQPSDIEKAKNLGASDYLVKSDIDLSKMVEKIKEKV